MPAKELPMDWLNGPGRRFWIFAIFMLTANVAAWVIYHRASGGARAGALRVERFEPGDGELPIGRGIEFVWKFNRDVARSGDGAAVKPVGRVQPQVQGQWWWADARTLKFKPHGQLTIATEYTFTLTTEGLAAPLIL